MEPGRTSSQATHRSRRACGARWNEERHAERSRVVPRLRPPTDRAGLAAPGTMMAYRIGFDVGGTFTYFVLQSPSGELHIAKMLTTYPDPSEACLAGLDELIAKSGVEWRDVPLARLPEPGPREAPGRARRPGGAARDRHDVARSVPDLPRVRADLDDRGERLRDDGRARVPARARRRHDGARLPRPALRHAVLGRCRDGGGDAALPGADDRVGSRRGRPDGGSVRRARGPPRSDRVRHGRHHRQASAD